MKITSDLLLFFRFVDYIVNMQGETVNISLADIDNNLIAQISQVVAEDWLYVEHLNNLQTDIIYQFETWFKENIL